jgi:predicted alpha/beta-hydrolase family hydrolase
MNKSQLLYDMASNAKKTFIFAHGAGAPMDSDWMNSVTKGLVQRNINVIRFEFPYMQERRDSGKKRPPNTKKVLIQTWKEVIKLNTQHEIYIGGKSMGGRIASLIADEVQASGLICLGFPFHAPGKDPNDRIEHLAHIKTPSLICQGTRDSMGNKEEVLTYELSDKIELYWLEDGDHGLKPRKKSGFTLEQHIESTCDAIKNFMQ